MAEGLGCWRLLSGNLSFVHLFLSQGEKNNGFDVLYHNMKHGQISTKELTDFIRERWDKHLFFELKLWWHWLTRPCSLTTNFTLDILTWNKKTGSIRRAAFHFCTWTYYIPGFNAAESSFLLTQLLLLSCLSWHLKSNCWEQCSFRFRCSKPWVVCPVKFNMCTSSFLHFLLITPKFLDERVNHWLPVCHISSF